MRAGLIAAAWIMCVGTAAHAGVIERACLRSERSLANRTLCGCIQDAANVTLNRGDQRVAARFFRDPQKAQIARRSDKSRDEAFWERYRRFGSVAEAYCER